MNSEQGQLYAWMNPGCQSVPEGAVRPVLFMLRKMARPLNHISRDAVVPRTASDCPMPGWCSSATSSLWYANISPLYLRRLLRI